MKLEDLEIFVINLENVKSRKNAMIRKIDELESANNIKLNIRFFSAVDAREESHMQAFSKYFIHSRSFFYRAKYLSRGELACFASHFKLWQQCAESNRPILVLEDDVLFDENFLDMLQMILDSNLPYVRLMALREVKRARPVYRLIYETKQICSGTQGYYIAPSAARAFMLKAKSWDYPVDDYMDMSFKHGVKKLVCLPFALHEKGITNIPDRTQKVRGIHKLRREFFRLIVQIRYIIDM